MQELSNTAVLLAIFGGLLAISTLFSKGMERAGVPVLLLFLVLGMIAGSEGIGAIAFDDYTLAFQIGTVALVLILFDGGFETPVASIRRVLVPAGLLATAGVAGTAALVAGAAYLLGFSWIEAAVLGSIVSSTDAAAVFSVLRGGGLNLKRRVGTLLEVESSINDPMAVILTTTLAMAAVGSGGLSWNMAWMVPLQLAIGLLVGWLAGIGGRETLKHIRLSSGGLYPVFTLALALVAFGAATLVNGSGFLAAYAAGVVMGNAEIPYKTGLARTHASIAWLSQISMFLVLGLLVFPTELLDVAGVGLALGLFLAVVARPVVVALLLAPFRMPANELIFVCWVGLRGAVPIILGTFPVLAGMPGAERIFNVVFFIVVVSSIIPGATLRWSTRRLRVEAPMLPAPTAALEVNSTQLLKGEVVSFHIDPTLAVCGVTLAKISFPPGAAAVMLVRGNELVACRGDTKLEQGDHVYVLCRPEDRPYIRLLFGTPEQDANL